MCPKKPNAKRAQVLYTSKGFLNLKRNTCYNRKFESAQEHEKRYAEKCTSKMRYYSQPIFINFDHTTLCQGLHCQCTCWTLYAYLY